MKFKRFKRFIIYVLLFNIIILVNVLAVCRICITKIINIASNFFFRSQGSKEKIVRIPDSDFQKYNLDKIGYPFEANYVELKLADGTTLPRVHYVDVKASGEEQGVVVCLHGEPSWSFLYRKLVPLISAAGYRVVIPDFIGFGKSDKYVDISSYTHELHTTTFKLLVTHLNLSKITLVVQDWGGITGLTCVEDLSDRIARLVIMNTGLPSGIVSVLGNNNVEKIKNLGGAMPFLLWRSIVWLLQRQLPISFLFQSAFGSSVTPEIIAAYSAPFPSTKHKAGAAKWPLIVPIFSWMPVAVDTKKAKLFLASHFKKPVLIMFSDNDPITRGQDKEFKKLFPHASQVRIHGGGHFLQEEKGEELAKHIIHFLEL